MTALLSHPVTVYHGEARLDWLRIRNREFDRVRRTPEEGRENLPRWAAHCYRWEPGDLGEPPKLADRVLFVGDEQSEVRAAALGWCEGMPGVDRHLYENRFDLHARGMIE